MSAVPPPLTTEAPLPEARHACDIVQSVMIAGATDNYHRIHWEHDYARQEGLPAAIVNNSLLLAWLEALVAETYGPAASLQRLAARFVQPVLLDEAVRCGGTVREATASAGGVRLALSLWVRDTADGVRVEAEAIVEVPT